MTVLFLSRSLVLSLFLCLTSTVGFRDLSRLSRGGFAAGSSFSLMREMEPFTTYIHFSLCVCGCTCVFTAACLCVHVQRERLSVYVQRFCEIGCAKICVHVFESACFCVCSYGVCFWVFCVHVYMCVCLCVQERFIPRLSTHCFKFFPLVKLRKLSSLCGCWTQHFIFSLCADVVDWLPSGTPGGIQLHVSSSSVALYHKICASAYLPWFLSLLIHGVCLGILSNI